jgi:hypothetical protein
VRGDFSQTIYSPAGASSGVTTYTADQSTGALTTFSFDGTAFVNPLQELNHIRRFRRCFNPARCRKNAFGTSEVSHAVIIHHGV